MEAKELMIGDHIYLDNGCIQEYAKVVEIYEYTIQAETSSAIYDDWLYFEPIPLTE